MILHLDMDAFFASVEQMDNPSLAGRPVIIGGGARGVVATASYEARAFGVHSAMPMAVARRLCPGGVFLHGRSRRYSELSARIMACLREFSPIVQPASIDEAYLDAKGCERLFGEPENLAESVKKRVARETGGLTCSIGMAPVKFLAKICSDQKKPDGVFILRSERMDAFLLALNIDKLPGVGKSMAASLRSYGIETVAQLRELSREFLGQRYGKHGLVLHDRAHGIDPRPVRPNEPAKSESAECTFSKDTFDKKIMARALLAHAGRVGERLRRHRQAGRTITIKIKFADFKQITRSRTIEFRTSATRTIFEVALGLLGELRMPKPARLVGLGVSGFEERPEQYYLPGIASRPAGQAVKNPLQAGEAMPECAQRPDREKRRQSLDLALDSLRRRFGQTIIQYGSHESFRR